jgi:hypothetical protein
MIGFVKGWPGALAAGGMSVYLISSGRADFRVLFDLLGVMVAR